MKKKVMALVLLGMTALSAFSQSRNIEVSGRVLEEANEPAIQATVQLLALPDSAQAAGVATSNLGFFTLPKVKAGKYVLKVSYIGYRTLLKPVQLSANKEEVNLGVMTLESDAVMLSEAVVTAEVAQVQVVEDTVQFNAAAFRTPEGAMLEELVKKLPGAEVDESGNVKINGKSIKKIMVNGKEFFGGDVQTGLQNLPVEMVDKLKTYDKKSDLTRITGIDDGEEETVLDLTVKKGMNKGLMSNLDLAAGTEHRYNANGMVSLMNDTKYQIQLIGRVNNVNNRGFSGGGGGGFRGRGNNGLTANKMFGVSFASELKNLELGGSARYNWSDNDAINTGYSENFLVNGNSTFSNSNSASRRKNQSFNADFRLEWEPDSLTNILFRPNVSWSDSKSTSISQSGTFNSDPLNIVANPNDYLDIAQLAQADILDDDPLKDIRVNLSNNNSVSKSNSLSANATLQLNRRLSANGRNITFRGQFRYGDSDSEQYSLSDTWYFQNKMMPNDTIRRFNSTPGTNYSYSGQFTYSEPIAKQTYLQFSYQFRYQYQENDRNTYDLHDAVQALNPGTTWNLGDLLPANYLSFKDPDQSKYAEYKTYEHEAMVGLRFIRDVYQLNAGVTFTPKNTELTYRKGDVDTVATRSVFNFAPRIDLRMRFSNTSQLRLQYNGRSSDPSMENLLPITDTSNPLSIRTGNPGLKPSFSHSMNLMFNTYDMEHQRSIFTHAMFSLTQNSVSQVGEYNEATGGWKYMPENINGNWNAMGGFGFNTALPNKKFTIGSFSNVNYSNNVGYQLVDKKNVKQTTTNLTLSENLNAAYRNSWFEFGVNGSISYSKEKSKLNARNDQEPITFSYGANTQIMLPWGMTLTTNINNLGRRGYSDSSMNRDELLWNAQLSQSLFKGKATLTFEMYDILKQQSNITRSLTASSRSVSQYNSINSYCMLHFVYRLNIFGSKEARQGMGNRRGFGGPGGGFGGGRGGFGGPPPGGGGRRPF